MRSGLRATTSRLLDHMDCITRKPWPADAPSRIAPEACRVGIVIASYNTAEILAGCLFSIFRILGDPRVQRVVVVDNGSSDKSPEMLLAMQDAGLIEVIFNRGQRQHGPALNQGINHLCRKQLNHPEQSRCNLIWILDSDAWILRADTLTASIDHLFKVDAAMAGEFLPSHMHPEIPGYIHPCSMLMNPAHIWRHPYPPFDRSGSPGLRMQKALVARGAKRLNFPFMANQYVLHLGRSTLNMLRQNNEQNHNLYEWSLSSFIPHYHGNKKGEAWHRSFLAQFQAELGGGGLRNLASICQKTVRLELSIPS